MLTRYIFIVLLAITINITTADLQVSNKARLEQYAQQYSKKHQKLSALQRKKKKIDRQVQYLRDKIQTQEADASEEAKLLALLRKQKRIAQKLKNKLG